MIKLAAHFKGFSSRSDKSATLRFETMLEMDPEQIAELQERLNDTGYLYFSENPVQESDIPKEIVEDKNKTPSKRQRAVLFLIWQSLGEPMGGFESFYSYRMEQSIQELKKEID